MWGGESGFLTRMSPPLKRKKVKIMVKVSSKKWQLINTKGKNVEVELQNKKTLYGKLYHNDFYRPAFDRENGSFVEMYNKNEFLVIG